MEQNAKTALAELRAAIRDLGRRNTPIDLVRFQSHFKTLIPTDAATLQQSVIFELRDLLKLIDHPIYRGKAERTCAETFVFFTDLYDWGRDDRLIDDTLVNLIDQWVEARRFKAYIRHAMAEISPEDYHRRFGHEHAERAAWRAVEERTSRLWARIGIGLVVLLSAVALLAKRLSP
jgi:hypothetical protein